MTSPLLVAVRLSVIAVECRAHPLDELEALLKREMRDGRDAARRPVILPGVTIEMAVFHREHPDRN